ncbi:hypothetical protein AMR42_06555 [Limnothrix sp. PR1529]|uniref:hypothetical protein n=1 Tax=Limnothrix sp. PR1529 TaxID=1704291 RepID=UPI00081ECCD8|nr:hypothetical protein [Limnothrix sp. PR1529]OCQ97540.1 hypothetical protein BCR12_04685 [Limnothrix sp. P13C2]PIB14343.1 hypothetical protein AMR42_06555 [Limnothrix sp. PR1529]
MSEENTTENQAPIDPELSASSELEDGELSEEELDAQSGGTGALPGGALPGMDDLFKGDVKVVEFKPASIDSSYTSASLTSPNSLATQAMPMNMTHHFP